MPDFMCVQCFSCRTFQVQQAKKSSNKFACRMCGEKQSVRKVFASSPAARDVRAVVQELNLARGRLEGAAPDGGDVSSLVVVGNRRTDDGPGGSECAATAPALERDAHIFERGKCIFKSDKCVFEREKRILEKDRFDGPISSRERGICSKEIGDGWTEEGRDAAGHAGEEESGGVGIDWGKYLSDGEKDADGAKGGEDGATGGEGPSYTTVPPDKARRKRGRGRAGDVSEPCRGNERRRDASVGLGSLRGSGLIPCQKGGDDRRGDRQVGGGKRRCRGRGGDGGSGLWGPGRCPLGPLLNREPSGGLNRADVGGRACQVSRADAKGAARGGCSAGKGEQECGYLCPWALSEVPSQQPLAIASESTAGPAGSAVAAVQWEGGGGDGHDSVQASGREDRGSGVFERMGKDSSSRPCESGLLQRGEWARSEVLESSPVSVGRSGGEQLAFAEFLEASPGTTDGGQFAADSGKELQGCKGGQSNWALTGKEPGAFDSEGCDLVLTTHLN